MRPPPGTLCTLLFLAFWAGAAFAASPDRTRLDSGPDGRLFGGYQLAGGESGEFALFTMNGARSAVAGLGVYNGRLAGVSIRPEDGAFLALTRDGALGVYGDESASLALPDSRWRMLDLIVHDGEPLAIHYQDGDLYLTRPNGEKSWTIQEPPIARDDRVAKAVLAGLGDEVHLVWFSEAGDLSRGALRHHVLRGNRWEELASLASGQPLTFAIFNYEKTMVLVAIITDPLRAANPWLLVREWRDGGWRDSREELIAEPLARLLLAGNDFSCREIGKEGVWLINSADGVTVVPSAQSFGGFDVAGDPVSLLDREGIAPRTGLAGLGLFLAFLLLLGLYCRRSRILSRNSPGKPADLISRGVALTVDWMLVSLGMTAYHVASGDIRILDDLANLEAVNQLFWINLAAFSLYTAITESAYGCTAGKFLAGLRVRNVRGGPPSVFQAAFRNLLRCLDMFPLPIGVPGLLGLLVALWNPRRQRLGDILASTIVLRHAPLCERAFILASASPRRRELMEALGVDMRTEPADIDEDAIQGDSPEDTARLLAEAKASAVVSALSRPREIVVAADTMVVLDGEILGKPSDRADAVDMLTRLSGRSHSVVTGVTVCDSLTGQGLSDVEITEVEFRDLSAREIDEYVSTGDPMDKAGAYGVQSGNMVKQVRGSLSNVAGLPMEKLRWMLSLLDS